MTARVASPAGLGRALVAIALVVAVISSLGAPLITPVAVGMGVSLDAAQWTLTVSLFAGAIAGPVLGRLGAGPHRRRTILIILALVTLGGALTTAPLPFWVLLVGRALQGLGLGIVALLMGVARDRLPGGHSGTTIAALSVASTVGIGVGYPLVGLLDQLAGLRAAYGLGFVLTLGVLIVAWRALPAEQPRPTARIDVAGALLLGIGTLGVLLVVAQRGVWTQPWVGVTILVAAIVILSIWVIVELRMPWPLVDLRLLAQPAVLRANFAMLIVGTGIYLLFSLLTRYLQTPETAGYGFGLSGFLAGAALIPFSVLGFVAGRLAPSGIARFSERWVYTASGVAVMIAAGLFAASPDSLIVILVAMAFLGLGLGGISAVMPRLVLGAVPASETASVLSINQIGRTMGFSIGSALAGLLLANATATDALLPAEDGYVVAALWTLPFVLISMAAIVLTRRRGSRR